MPDLLATLAEPTRREILRLVWEGERSAGDIAARFPVSFSAISQHLGALRAAGAVVRRREGRRQLYRADRAGLGPLGAYFDRLWGTKLDDLRRLAEAEQRALDDRPARGVRARAKRSRQHERRQDSRRRRG